MSPGQQTESRLPAELSKLGENTHQAVLSHYGKTGIIHPGVPRDYLEEVRDACQDDSEFQKAVIARIEELRKHGE